MIIELLQSLGVWTWWIAAAVLFVFELMAPGIFFMWLGLSAVVVGILELIVDMPWQAEVAIFAVLSVVNLVVSRKFLNARSVPTDQPNLNRRMLNYVGRNYVLKQPIVNGEGELEIEGTHWKIRGRDTQAGSWVHVREVDGMVLVVDPADGP